MIHTKSSISSLFLLTVISFGVVACDSPSTPGGTADGATATAEEDGKDAPTKPASAPAAVEMVEHDLSSAHEVWKGWVAMGPKDAKVLADGVNGARIAGKGPSILDRKEGGDNGFDVAFEPGKMDLKSLKTNLEKGAANPDAQMKLAFSKDEPTMLEWTAEVGSSKTYNFVMHMQAEGKDFTCKNNYMVGAGNEAEHKRQLDACKTLKKK